MKQMWPGLLQRLQAATAERGGKAAMAKAVGVSLPTLSHWLHGKTVPGAEYTLRLQNRVLRWEDEHKSPRGAQSPRERKTRSSKSPNEKTKSGQREA